MSAEWKLHVLCDGPCGLEILVRAESEIADVFHWTIGADEKHYCPKCAAREDARTKGAA